jgi:hypothetical protein
MEETIRTTLLEYNKSTFLIDLVKHSNGLVYIAIQQTVQHSKEKAEIQKIKINPSILPDIIEVLSQFKEELPLDSNSSKNYFTPGKIQEIIKRYLKGGIETKHLAVQFECSEQIIEQILQNKGIAIMSNEMPKHKKYWRRNKKQ